MLEAQQFRNLEIGAVGQFLLGARFVIFACPDVGGATGWTAEGTVCLRYLIYSRPTCFLQQAEPRLRIRAKQFRLCVSRKLAFANEGAYALFAEWERIVGAEQHAVRAHDLDQKLQGALVEDRGINIKSV